MPYLFLFVSVVGTLFTINAYRPTKNRVLMGPSFFASWLTIELAGHHFLWQAAAVGVLIWLGALEAWAGWVALGLTVASWIGLGLLVHRGRKASETLREAMAQLADDPGDGPKIPRRHVYFPILTRRPGVRRIKDVPYRRAGGRNLKLDVFLPPGDPAGAKRPAIMQIHGGGWVIGDKREQGIPMLGHLAANGWVGFNVNYRLSPSATFPEHLIDLKAALVWIRDHADDYGVDPGFIAVTGNSAGGHLTALMGLTANDPEYQPGFEDGDTSVQAAIPFYGIYDFTDRLGSQVPGFLSLFIEPYVMKAFLADEPEKFRKASPIDLVHPEAPPFLVLHGDRDTLAPLADARLFVERLREASEQPVLYAELRGAQHAFDIIMSPRAAPAIEGVERFLSAIHEDWQRGLEGDREGQVTDDTVMVEESGDEASGGAQADVVDETTPEGAPEAART